jgi:hypothetical protein
MNGSSHGNSQATGAAKVLEKDARGRPNDKLAVDNDDPANY